MTLVERKALLVMRMARIFYNVLSPTVIISIQKKLMTLDSSNSDSRYQLTTFATKTL